MPNRSAVALALLAAALPSTSRAAAPAPPPRLVVVIAVDQLGRDRLGPELPGGLGRLVREGRVFADATLDHGVTETCPGHATLLTGAHPRTAGIPGNSLFVDGRTAYCASDADPAATPAELDAAAARAGVLGVPAGPDPRSRHEALRSPRRLAVDALGDWLPAPRKVIAVAGKDRAAIMMGGKRPTLAIWLHEEAGFTTSRAYAPALPPWLAAFDRERGLVPFRPEKFPEVWRHREDDPRALPDDHPAEWDRYSRTSPHPVRAATLPATVSALLRTPLADALTLDVARAAIAGERLGAGPGPALLAISLSATDYIGHAYGVDSQEAAAALRELDDQLGRFLRDLERAVPRERLLVVLTADHGATPAPEAALALGTSGCRAPGGRVAGATLVETFAAAAREVCGLERAPAVAWDGNAAFALPPALWAGGPGACRVPRAEALPAVAARAAAVPGVVKAWTADALEGAGCTGFCRLQRNSLAPGRSGDLSVQLDPGCLLTGGATGGGHGTPYLPDRAVPLVFWGGGIAASVVRGPARTIDLAPTLAARLGVTPPRPLDGKPLPLR